MFDFLSYEPNGKAYIGNVVFDSSINLHVSNPHFNLRNLYNNKNIVCVRTQKTINLQANDKIDAIIRSTYWGAWYKVVFDKHYNYCEYGGVICKLGEYHAPIIYYGKETEVCINIADNNRAICTVHSHPANGQLHSPPSYEDYIASAKHYAQFVVSEDGIYVHARYRYFPRFSSVLDAINNNNKVIKDYLSIINATNTLACELYTWDFIKAHNLYGIH